MMKDGLSKEMFVLGCVFTVISSSLIISAKAEETSAADESYNEHIQDVMDYCGNWQGMIDNLNMTQVYIEGSIGDSYEIDNLIIEMGSWGGVLIKNDGYQDLCISGAVLGDGKEKVREKLKKESWLFRGPSREGTDIYMTKRGDEYYDLAVYYSIENGDTFNGWYLSNWNEEYGIEEVWTGYDAFVSVSEAWKKEYIEFIENNFSIFYNMFIRSK